MAKHVPRGLSLEAARLYRETITETGMDVIADAASLTLLENAARALDRLRQAEKVVRKEGATVKDRFQQLRPHPMVARIDCEGQAVRKCLAGIVNHSAAARFKRGLDRVHGASAVEDDPWGRRAAGQDGTGTTI